MTARFRLPVPAAPSTAPGQRATATWPGRSTARPAGAYDPAAAVRDVAAAEGAAVDFAGEDGRTRTFRFATLPLPGWHDDLAAAFARLTGPTGGRRTLAAAEDAWQALGRLLRLLDSLPQPPHDVARLTARHLRRFELHRRRTVNQQSVARELRTLLRLLGEVAPPDRLRPEVVELVGQCGRATQGLDAPGYSEQEFRRIMAVARHDVAMIRDRIAAGERLLAGAEAGAEAEVEPAALPAADRGAAAALQAMARTGTVPPARQAGCLLHDSRAMVEFAGQLFVTDADLAPLLVLGVGITGRNGETLKELPAGHELLEGRAVAVELIKRRRGPNNIHEVVHWEVGAPSRQLHTPGGYYLLVHALARRGRTFSGSQLVWSIWNVRSGHVSPFAKRLDRKLYLRSWARAHALVDDDGQPLELSLNRLRTTVAVRTTRATGGHLPTSARRNSNTMDVLFAHYLRGDATVTEWAASEVAAALHDAEQHARQAHLRVLAGPAEQHAHDPAAAAVRLGVDPEVARQAMAGDLDTAVAACLDIDDSPFNQGRCRASFLTCLHCPNALVTHRHLPGLLGLLEQLERERSATDAEAWWARHGRTWLAITDDVLPKFTPAECERAKTQAAATPAVSLLDLLHGPWEQP